MQLNTINHDQITKFKFAVNCVYPMVNYLWLRCLVIFINHKLSCVNHIFELHNLVSEFYVKVLFGSALLSFWLMWCLHRCEILHKLLVYVIVELDRIIPLVHSIWYCYWFQIWTWYTSCKNIYFLFCKAFMYLLFQVVLFGIFICCICLLFSVK